MKHSVLCRGLALIMAMGLLLVGCGTPKDASYGLNPQEPVAITVWHYYNGSQKVAFDNLVEAFNETTGKELGIVVEATSKGGVNDLIQAVTDSAEGKVGAAEMPNIFSAYSDTARKIDQMGLLASLEGYFSQEELDQYVPGYLADGYIDGTDSLKLFPVAKSTEILMVNKTDWDTFSQATGASLDALSTWEGLCQTAAQYYEYSGGKSFFGRDAYANYMIIGSRQLGQEVFQVQNGEVTLNLNRDAMRRLWDNMYVPMVQGHFGKYGRFASDDAKTGDIIALVGSTSGATYFPESVAKDDVEPYPIDCLVLPLPGFAGAEPFAVQQGAGMAVAKTDATREYASVVFLKWLTEADRNILFSLSASYMPVKKEANDIDRIKAVMEENGIQVSPIVEQTLETSIQEAKTYQFYTSKPFDNGTEARAVMENHMVDRALADKAAVEAQIAQGVSRREALAPYLSDENFDAWFQDFSKALRQVVGQ